MPVADVIRESFVGQLIYLCSKRRYFRYAEEYPDFVLPDHYATLVDQGHDAPSNPGGGSHSETATLADQDQAKKLHHPSGETRKDTVQVTERQNSGNGSDDASTISETRSRNEEIMRPSTAGAADPEKGPFVEMQRRKLEEERRNPFIVDWYSPTDPENPRNVSFMVPLVL